MERLTQKGTAYKVPGAEAPGQKQTLAALNAETEDFWAWQLQL